MTTHPHPSVLCSAASLPQSVFVLGVALASWVGSLQTALALPPSMYITRHKTPHYALPLFFSRPIYMSPNSEAEAQVVPRTPSAECWWEPGHLPGEDGTLLGWPAPPMLSEGLRACPSHPIWEGGRGNIIPLYSFQANDPLQTLPSEPPSTPYPPLG